MELKVDRVTAVLFNVVSENDRGMSLVGTRISGNIYCDRNDRFRDAEIITTSPIVDVFPKGLVVTRSGSIYKIASWA